MVPGGDPAERWTIAMWEVTTLHHVTPARWMTSPQPHAHSSPHVPVRNLKGTRWQS